MTEIKNKPYLMAVLSGVAYRESCLLKDVESFVTMAKSNYLELPIIENIANSNNIHISNAIEKIKNLNSKRIGFLGLSFKPGTDDLRNSPYVILAEHLIGKGYNLKIFDKNINLSKLLGSNKRFIEEELSHIDRLLVNEIEEIFDYEIILLNQDYKIEHLVNESHVVIDLR